MPKYQQQWEKHNNDKSLTLLEIQQHGCAICGTKDRELHVDHDHSSGEIRGLLCRSCNTWLGHHLDKTHDRKYLAKALQYVLYPPAKSLDSPTPGEKRCARCNMLKALTEFYHYRGKPISYCRPCNSEYHSEQQVKKSLKISEA